ncbi:MAG: hypothetical protein LQ346_007350 [Caloplaca aetnensis]|nr:MAG: hypothetical protein LQ346_007350 [Caloplaca aetnensis]
MPNIKHGEDTHDTQAAHVLSDKDVRHFLRRYYYIANEPALDQEYGDLFTEDGVFIMGNRKATGREAIRNLRKKVWEEVPNRDHDMVKAFSHGNHDDDTELMILGTATWTYHEGHQNVGDWAAHVKLEKGEDGKIECSYYQIIMDHAVHDRKPEKEKEKGKEK